MKKISGLLLLLLSASASYSQLDFEMTFPTYDRIVAGGAYALFDGTIELDNDDATKNFKFVAKNISLPDDWVFVLCTPELCAAENIDTIDFEYNEDAISDLLSLKVYTSTNPLSTFGELDLKLIDTETGEFVEKHFTVTVAPAGIEIEETVNPIINNYSSKGFISLSEDIEVKSFIVYNYSGRVILKNDQFNGHTITTVGIPKGLYIIHLNTNVGILRERIIIS